MTELTLLCLIEGTDSCFPVDIERTKTVGDLKKSIKKSPKFDGIAADELTLWRVKIPTASPGPFKMVEDKTKVKSADRSEYPATELDETTKISKVFDAELSRRLFTSLCNDRQSTPLLHSLAICRMNLVLGPA
ncbi:hypothetical protein BGX34_000777 [Mortierella sp. NVP85]|nr:hypothetical protein BGX34_000777 [Mortierella sp. NVP85]